MRDSQIAVAFRAVLLPYIEAEFPGTLMVRQNQTTMQGIPEAPTIFFHKVTDHRYGFPRTDYAFQLDPTDPDNLMMPGDTVQVIESRYQFMCLAHEATNDPAPVTPSDRLRYLALLMSVDGILASLRSRGLNMMRILDVVNPAFEDDNDQFAAHPSFDVVIQHHEVIRLPVPRVVEVVPEVHAV